MTASQRPRARDSTTRDLLVAATSQIMVEEGYAAATSRRVAAKAGVKPALVHYYFPTMDELYLAVFRRGAAVYLERQQKALASDPMKVARKVEIVPSSAMISTKNSLTEVSAFTSASALTTMACAMLRVSAPLAMLVTPADACNAPPELGSGPVSQITIGLGKL